MRRNEYQPVPLSNVIRHQSQLDACCLACQHAARLDLQALADRFGEHALLRPTIIERLVCSACGSREVTFRQIPNAHQYRE